MSIEYSWDRCFSPAEAERGKFLPIDTPTLTSFGYPLTGRGKYAEMVYLVNPEDVMISVSGLVFNISGVSIDEPVTIDIIQHTVAVSGAVSILGIVPVSGFLSISALNIDEPITIDYITNTAPVSGTVNVDYINHTVAVSGGPITVDYIQNVVAVSGTTNIDYVNHTVPVSGSISISVIQPNTLYIASSTIDDKAHIFTPSQSLQLLEIYNRTDDWDAYVMLSATSFDNLTAWGIPVVAGGYYSIETEINTFTVGSELSADLRIMGHYRT